MLLTIKKYNNHILIAVYKEPLCSYSACSMPSLLRCNSQTIVQGSEASFRGSCQALSIADRGLSAPQGQQDGLKW